MEGSKQAGVALRDVVDDLVEGVAAQQDEPPPWRSGSRLPWKPGPRNAKREGFISMTTMRPFFGVDGELHVRTAGLNADLLENGQRCHAHALVFNVAKASEQGATVMESPVCTPMGSRFSMEQTMMPFPALSRMTSISNSFQPSMALFDEDLAGRGQLKALATR